MAEVRKEEEKWLIKLNAIKILWQIIKFINLKVKACYVRIEINLLNSKLISILNFLNKK